GNFDANHEGPDLRLIVGQAPPVEPNDILFRNRLVTARDHLGKFLDDIERELLLLHALDRIALEHKIPSRLNRFARSTDCRLFRYHLNSSGGRPAEISRQKPLSI